MPRQVWVGGVCSPEHQEALARAVAEHEKNKGNALVMCLCMLSERACEHRIDKVPDVIDSPTKL